MNTRLLSPFALAIMLTGAEYERLPSESMNGPLRIAQPSQILDGDLVLADFEFQKDWIALVDVMNNPCGNGAG
jgi:hypothetical protein